jgi:sulfonate transport system permease protein
VRRHARRLVPWAVPLLLVALWQVLGTGAGAKPGILPTPWLVARAGGALFRTGEIFHHGWISLERAGLGLLIGGGVGFILGLANGYSSLSEKLLDTPVQMVRNVPHLALIPLVIIWFGLGEASKVFLVALGVLFPMYSNTLHGVRSIDPGLIEMGRLYGLGKLALFAQVIVPGALPSVLVGLRFALGLMWLSLIVAETIGADAGIGYLAMNAREFMQTDVVIFSIIVYALLGKAADLVVRLMERVLLRWEPRYLAPVAAA